MSLSKQDKSSNFTNQIIVLSEAEQLKVGSEMA